MHATHISLLTPKPNHEAFEMEFVYHLLTSGHLCFLFFLVLHFFPKGPLLQGNPQDQAPGLAVQCGQCVPAEMLPQRVEGAEP